MLQTLSYACISSDMVGCQFEYRFRHCQNGKNQRGDNSFSAHCYPVKVSVLWVHTSGYVQCEVRRVSYPTAGFWEEATLGTESSASEYRINTKSFSIDDAMAWNHVHPASWL